MTTVTDVCIESLLMIGARTTVSAVFPTPDGSTEAAACFTLYPRISKMILRAAHWNAARKQIAATVVKRLYINGVPQQPPNAPPVPWCFEYAVPADSLKERFILNQCPTPSISPPLTTGPQTIVPNPVNGFAVFVVGLDYDADGNPLKVFYTNQPQAQLVYTADISQAPDLWDAQLHVAISSTLAAYLVNPLARNSALLHDCIAGATGALDSARATDGNEGLPSQDHVPDFIQIRFTGASWGSGGWGPNGACCAGWDQAVFPGGLRY